jgi:TolA-binding protein
MELDIKIDAYLKGHLSESETAAFAQQMAEDKDVSKRVAQHKLHIEAMELLLEDDLRENMNTWDAEIEAQTTKTNNGKIWGWALLILGVLTTLYITLRPKTKQEPPSIQNNLNIDNLKNKAQKSLIENQDTLKNPSLPPKNNDKTPPIQQLQQQKAAIPIAENTIWVKDFLNNSKEDLIAVVTDLEAAQRSEKTDTVLKESYRFLKNKDYPNAIKTLKNTQNIDGTSRDNREGVYALAMAHYLNNDYATAQPLFAKLANNQGFYQVETAEYYAALCKMAMGQMIEAKQQLTIIANDTQHPYSTKATTILSTMK